MSKNDTCDIVKIAFKIQNQKAKSINLVDAISAVLKRYIFEDYFKMS